MAINSEFEVDVSDAIRQDVAKDIARGKVHYDTFDAVEDVVYQQMHTQDFPR